MSTIALRQMERLSVRTCGQARPDAFQMQRCTAVLEQVLEKLSSAYKRSVSSKAYSSPAALDVLQERVDQILLPETTKNDLLETIVCVIHRGHTVLPGNQDEL